MSYAVINLGGKQYKVTAGETIIIDKLTAAEPEVEFKTTEVLLLQTDSAVKIGTPYVEGASVTLLVTKHFKGDKLRVATYKAKARSRKVHGHRQHLSKVRVVAVQ